MIPALLADEMIEHCRSGIPNEACGVLASKDGVIVKVLPMRNVDRSPVRYSFDPKEQFLAYRFLDEQGWELGGVFHSHTRTEALPSPTDVRLASEDVPYVIVSFESEPPIIRAFRIVKEEWDAPDGEVEEIPVKIER
jgi:[CysO sulfur-carrier protein]-S-L-cysteine hydrolase